jgi:hypothetical protein
MENKRTYALSIRRALKSAVQQAKDNHANMHIPTQGQRGAVIGIINRVAGGDDNRKLLLGWLFANEGEIFNRVSTKSLDDEQWSALYAWCDFRKDEDRVIWIPKETFSQECLACLSAAMDDYFDVSFMDADGLPSPPDIVAAAVEIGQGEITFTGVKMAGIKGVDDEVFAHEKDLPRADTPPSPYIKAEPGERIETEEPAIKPLFVKKPKLYNPFD